MKIKEFCVMEDVEFNEIVENTIKQKYSFAFDMDCGNDSDYVFNDIGYGIYYNFERDKIKRFIGCGEGKFLARTLLKHLVEIGKLKSGNYLIRVSY